MRRTDFRFLIEFSPTCRVFCYTGRCVLKFGSRQDIADCHDWYHSDYGLKLPIIKTTFCLCQPVHTAIRLFSVMAVINVNSTATVHKIL